MDKEKTGEYIRALRKNKGWTQMQLAEQLHISDKAVSKWERGISFPDIELMEELAQVFQVDVADIIRGEEAGRAEHTVNELVKDTIDIAKREKKKTDTKVPVGVVYSVCAIWSFNRIQCRKYSEKLYFRISFMHECGG